jgi:hypothetical protein
MRSGDVPAETQARMRGEEREYARIHIRLLKCALVMSGSRWLPQTAGARVDVDVQRVNADPHRAAAAGSVMAR